MTLKENDGSRAGRPGLIFQLSTRFLSKMKLIDISFILKIVFKIKAKMFHDTEKVILFLCSTMPSVSKK
jgi:hypothetical protein